MQHYTIPLHDWYLGAQPKIHNFGRDSKNDLLVIFNSRYCRLVGQVLFQQLCLLVGKDLNLSIRNIFKGATSCWQDEHRVESFSSSAIVDLLRAVWNALQRLLWCWSTCTQFMQHYTIPLHDWYLGAQAKIHNFGRDSKNDLLVIFNSRYCKLVGQVLFQQLCLLVGKDLNLSIRNIFKAESFSSNSSTGSPEPDYRLQEPAQLALESLAGTLLDTLQGFTPEMRALAHCGCQYRPAPPWQGSQFVFARGADCVDCKSGSPVIGALDCSVSLDIRTIWNSNANWVFQWLCIQRNVMEGCSQGRWHLQQQQFLHETKQSQANKKEIRNAQLKHEKFSGIGAHCGNHCITAPFNSSLDAHKLLL